MTDPDTPLVILVAGWAGSGKDTVASILVSDHGFHRLAFADPLKEDVSRRTGLPLATFHDPAVKDVPLDGHPASQTPRALLIERAAEVRATDPDHYARIIGEHILEEIAETGQRMFVISDWRYRREYEHLRSLPGLRLLCIRVERPGIQPSAHPSENDLERHPAITTVIWNDGSLADLRDTVSYFLQIYAHTST